MHVNLKLILLASVLLLAGCEKRKTRIINGTLLLCNSIPTPVANKQIEIYQRGSGYDAPIYAGSESSLATGQTNSIGDFSIKFKPGKAEFLIFSGANASPLTLRTPYDDTSFPVFSRSHFNDSLYANRPIYIGKLIDTLIIHLRLAQDIVPTDTIRVNVYTVDKTPTRFYWGRSAQAGGELILDTFYQALATGYDEATQKFGVPASLAKWMYVPAGYTAGRNLYPAIEYLPPQDEKRVDVLYTWFFP